jgi:uncharacterized protein
MLKFIIAYLLIYSGVHAVFFHRFRVLLPANGTVTLVFAGFLGLMVLSPLITRILEVQGYDTAARMAACAAYFWMGFLFLSFAGSLVLYVADVVAWAVRMVTPFSVPRFSGRLFSSGLMLLSLALVTYGYLNAKKIAVEHISVSTEKLPPHINTLRIAQISDVHLGILHRESALQKIMDRVRSCSPDILVCTGDLVDGSMQNLMHLSDIIRQVDPPLGKFAVTGNHEYYAGLDHSLEFMRKSGFRILRDEAVGVGDIINIAGVNDGERFRKTDDGKALHQIKNNRFTVYLKHRPEVPDPSKGSFDLQLSGHTHNGQIFPFNFLVLLEFPYIKGYYPLKNGSALYVNRGTGTWGPPMRIGSDSEITVIDIKRK